MRPIQTEHIQYGVLQMMDKSSHRNCIPQEVASDEAHNHIC